MTDIAALIAGGAGNAWVFMPSSILLGALHGLEPGHSKTMMAAFIIAVRGTVGQAVLLGLAATLSHTAVVWAIALIGLHFGAQWNSETSEPYFQLISGLLIIGIALWMLRRTWRELHHHDHHHHHHDEIHGVDTAIGRLTLEPFEDGVPPRWRLRVEAGQQPGVERIALETRREDGTRQVFTFAARYGYLESVEETYRALVLGTRDYVCKTGFQQVVLGLSGGVDSSLVAAVAADALGPQNVLGVRGDRRWQWRRCRSP